MVSFFKVCIIGEKGCFFEGFNFLYVLNVFLIYI